MGLYDKEINEIQSKSSSTFYDLKMDGGVLPIRFNNVPNSDVLVVSFRGAANRSKEKYPVFFPEIKNLNSYAHHLTIADPALSKSDDLSIAWYLGYDGFNLQKLLPEFIKELASSLGVRRTVYLGGSGGGFAALYYSRMDSKSAALVMSPQINLANYSSRLLGLYIKNCWPKHMDNIESLKRELVLNVSDVYSDKKFDNFIVYLQSYKDEHHMFRHMPYFASSIGSRGEGRVIFCFNYWGIDGHSGSVPMWAWSKWLFAIGAAKDLNVESVTDIHNKLPFEEPSANVVVSKTEHLQPTLNQVRMADLLKDFQLK